jgi:hypothetical protein
MKYEYIRPIVESLPLVTDFPSRKHWEAAVWQIIVERLLKATSVVEFLQILQFLTSPRERTAITYRALAASRIATGIGPSEISRELWLSRSTIVAIKKSLAEGEYKSSHARGHKKKEYTISGPERKVFKHKPVTLMGAVREEQRNALRARRLQKETA